MVIIAITVLIATIIGSISGIGGGVLIKPVMDAVCDMTSTQISFLSGVTVLTMTIVSLLRSRKQLKIEFRTLMLAVGSAIGGVLGKQLFGLINSTASNDASVALVQNIVMVFLTTTVFIYTLNKERIRTRNCGNAFLSIIIGLIMGVFSSFLGIGGGPINIMILSYFYSLDTKNAALCSLFVILFSQALSLCTTLVANKVPEFSIWVLLLMMLLAVVGSTLGRKLSEKMDNKAVDKVFLYLLVVIIFLSVYNCIKFYCIL